MKTYLHMLRIVLAVKLVDQSIAVPKLPVEPYESLMELFAEKTLHLQFRKESINKI